MNKRMLLLFIFISIGTIDGSAPNQFAGSLTPGQSPAIKFDVLSLNVALLALTTQVPTAQISTKKVTQVKTPQVKIKSKKILGFKTPSINIPGVNVPIKVPTVKVEGTTVRLREVGHLQENEKRAKLIAATIKELNRAGNAPDIFMIQEAFDTTIVSKVLYNQIKAIYPYAVRDTRSGRIGFGYQQTKFGQLPIGTNSGLALFSKYPIKRELLRDYTCFGGEGAFARKGLLGVELDIKGQRVYVFTTHLQAGLGAEPFKKLEASQLLAREAGACIVDGQIKQQLTTDEMRRAELQQAKVWIEEFAVDKNAPVIFGGDLNIDAKNLSNTIIRDVFPTAQILYNESKSSYTGTVWDVKNRRVEEKRIDYLMILRNPENRLSGDAWVIDRFGPDHTDHLGYYGEFGLQK